MLQCSKCCYKKVWTTQSEGGLNEIFYAAVKMYGGCPDKIDAINRMICTGRDEEQQIYGNVVKNKIIPVINKLFIQQQYEIIQEIQQTMREKKESGIVVSLDCTYASRNNNSDHRVVTFVEHCTLNNYLLHIEQEYASAQCTPHQLESKLTLDGLKYN